MEQTNLSKGFVIVASVDEKFFSSAVFCGESLREYYPDANITLFTEDRWITDSLYNTFNTVIGGAPHHKRAKLWALSQTPYDLTVYLDADIEIVHPDISKIFDCITETADIMITKIRPYNSKITKFPGGELVDHCGMFMYRKTPKVIKFMEQWWDLNQKQKTGEWRWDTKLYPEELRKWDQWAYWWLQNKTDYSITREYLPDDARWNFVNGYRQEELNGKPLVVYHHTVKSN